MQDCFLFPCDIGIILVLVVKKTNGKVKLDLKSLNWSSEYSCSLYDEVTRPSKLPANADFHLFKAGVEPKWEDPECVNGGKWTAISSKKAALDTMWLETVTTFIFLGCNCCHQCLWICDMWDFVSCSICFCWILH